MSTACPLFSAASKHCYFFVCLKRCGATDEDLQLKFAPIRRATEHGTSPARNDKAPLPQWRFVWLLAAPHRVAFFSAALMLAISSLWWSFVLVTRAVGIALPWAIPVSAAHGLLMTMGFMPMFFVGFLFTAGPKWLHLREVPARSLMPGLLLMLVGWAFVLIGFHLNAPVSCAGLALVAFAWTSLSIKFSLMVRASAVPDRIHARMVAVAGGIGAVVLWVGAASLGVGSDLMLRAATQMGIWGFIAVVFTVVSHRMIPFFSASAVPILDAWRPMWLLYLIVIALWMQALLSVAALWLGPFSPALRWGQVAIELPLCLLLLRVALRWGLVQTRKIRLVVMLHIGFIWLGASFALSAVSHAWMAMSDGAYSLGLAPLHALAMGYLGSIMFSMTTRVSAGHGGRPVTADNLVWTLFWILQAAVLLRIAAAIWPVVASPLLLMAITAWAATTVLWALRYARWFGRPRLDGRPG